MERPLKDDVLESGHRNATRRIEIAKDVEEARREHERGETQEVSSEELLTEILS